MHNIYNHIDRLEALADKHGLMLSTELINFADDVWAMATQAEQQTKAQLQANNSTPKGQKYESRN